MGPQGAGRLGIGVGMVPSHIMLGQCVGTSENNYFSKISKMKLKWKAILERLTSTQEKWVVLGLVYPCVKLQRVWSLLGEAPRHSLLERWPRWGTRGLLLYNIWSISPRSVLGYSCFTRQPVSFFFFPFRLTLLTLFFCVIFQPDFDFRISRVIVSLTM